MTTGLRPWTATAATLPGAPTVVLVVEDDDDHRELLTIHLQRAGCAVVATGRPAEALAAIRDLRLDLAVVDVHLPGGAGDAVLELLRRHRPGCRIVLSSPLDRAAFPAAAEVLGKPFTGAQVARLVPQRPGALIPAPRSGSAR